ncbi:hypothetical protein Tco_1319109 [Tanacetum coccineum]
MDKPILGGGTNCGIIDWFDPPMCDRAVQIVPGLLRTMNELQDTISHYRAQETNVENHVEAIAHYPAHASNVENHVEAIAHYSAHAPNVENHADYQREARRMKILLVLSWLVFVFFYLVN